RDGNRRTDDHGQHLRAGIPLKVLYLAAGNAINFLSLKGLRMLRLTTPALPRLAYPDLSPAAEVGHGRVIHGSWGHGHEPMHGLIRFFVPISVFFVRRQTDRPG